MVITKIENNKEIIVKKKQGWRRSTWISNDELENVRLNFSRCASSGLDPLRQLSVE